jgi:hypothetical protein
MITSGPHRLGRSRPTPSPDWSTAMRDGHGDARRAVSLRPLACRPRGALPRYGSQLRRAPGWGPLHRLALCHTFQTAVLRETGSFGGRSGLACSTHIRAPAGALASIGLDPLWQQLLASSLIGRIPRGAPRFPIGLCTLLRAQLSVIHTLPWPLRALRSIVSVPPRPLLGQSRRLIPFETPLL